MEGVRITRIRSSFHPHEKLIRCLHMRPQFSFIQGDIRIEFPCPLCEAGSKKTSVSVIEQKPQQMMAHILCQDCDAGFLVHMTMQGSELACIALLSDLSAEEAKSSLSSAPVSMDEVLGVEQALEHGGLA